MSFQVEPEMRNQKYRYCSHRPVHKRTVGMGSAAGSELGSELGMGLAAGSEQLGMGLAAGPERLTARRELAR